MTQTGTTHKTFCSICTAFCGFEATVEDGRVAAMTPDRDHPMSRGFSCTKGRQAHLLLEAPDRLARAMRREGGTLVAADLDVVLDEVAERLARIRAEHGPSSIAVYAGNGATFKTTASPAAHAWLAGLGSHQFYSSLTIDQPAKITAAGRIGVWAGGTHDFSTADVAMSFGNNVVVSGLNVPGAPPGWRPRAIREARERGLRLIVVDPRRTQTAALADLHLQIRPGEDAVLLAGMLRMVLAEGLHDREFCEEFVDGLDELTSAVEPFTPDLVSRRTGLASADVEEAVRLFTSGRRGTASSATGPDMGPHGNLTEHLIGALNVVCGRFNRAGEVDVTSAVLMPDLPSVAAVVPRDFLPPTLNPAANTRRSRIHGAHQLYQEMPTSTLADEILTPGEGQVRALVVIGGNPMTSWPDRDKTERALADLDLLVCLEVRRTDTVEVADYVLPCSYGLERPELTAYNDFLYDAPFVQYAEPVVDPPGDAQEEWRHLAALAHRMGTPIELAGGPLDVADPPTTAAFMDLLFPEGTTRVPMAEIRSHPGGKVYEHMARPEVQPAFEGMDERFRLYPDGVAEEFADLLAHEVGVEGSFGPGGAYTHLLTCRRHGKVYNSMCHEVPQTAGANPALVHPDDLVDLGVSPGDVVVLRSEHGAIDVEVGVDDTLRRGTVSVHHGFGARASAEDGPRHAAVSRLLSTDATLDRLTRMPIMTAVPVRFETARSAAGA